jgi:DNA-binding CsgD family transcriptional regulator
LRREITGVLGPLAFAQGDHDVAWQQVNSLLPDGPTTAPGGVVLLDALLLQRLAAALCQEAGRLAEAASWLEAHDRWLAWSGATLGRADGRAAWATYWLAAGDPARARSYADDAVAAADQPLQPLARLVALRLRGQAAAAGGDSAAADDDFAEALALAEACAAPYERALTLLALAESHCRANKTPAGAADLLDEARAICERLDAHPALQRIDALAAGSTANGSARRSSAGDVFTLTPRELEVLALLATGCTNVEIAERLFLSPGTVRNHVSIILGKLGARTRTEAAAIARDHTLV